jgi:two-component system, cell cycle sensor histidine kinase and response regulator CckA
MFAGKDLIKSKSRVILLVDDDLQFLSVGQELLEYLGFKALIADNGDQALEIFRQRHSIDLVIMDFNLPHLDGYQLLHQLQTIAPEVKVIITSGFFAQSEIEKFLRAGVVGMIHKPFRAEQLHAEIIRVLGD